MEKDIKSVAIDFKTEETLLTMTEEQLMDEYECCRKAIEAIESYIIDIDHTAYKMGYDIEEEFENDDFEDEDIDVNEED